jgi:hypothetical protein
MTFKLMCGRSLFRSVFQGNVVERPPKERYGGGGSLWLAEVPPSSSVSINAQWRDNIHKFEHGTFSLIGPPR